MWKVLLLLFIGEISYCYGGGCVYRNRECPNYEVIKKHEDYEIRRYPAITWATKSTEHNYARIAQTRSFMSLFSYITGANNMKIHMDMTVPVRMNVTSNQDKYVHKMSFMIPSKHIHNYPIPYDNGITIVREPPTTYAVKVFSGYPWRQATWIQEAEKLAQSLEDDETVVKSWFYQVEYESEDTYDNRRNEIWMVKKSS